MSEKITASEWSFEKIQALVAGRIEERYDLEFKGAGALAPKNPQKKRDIVTDVSAMANSAGGTIIYGISEASDNKDSAPYANEIVPIDRNVFSSETLDQVIQSIQPKIDGVRIEPIDIPEAPGQAVYVVEVPQSDTVHQATDKKYHKRHNTTTTDMDDYEIRDVMNRSKHPKIRVSFIFNTFPDKIGLEICVANRGKIIARHIQIFICMPMCLGIDIPEREGHARVNIQNYTTEYCWKNLHYDFVGKSPSSDARISGYAGRKTTEDCFVGRNSPILPRTTHTSPYGLALTPKNMNSLEGKEITWDAYADNAPVQSGKLDLSVVYQKLRAHYTKE